MELNHLEEIPDWRIAEIREKMAIDMKNALENYFVNDPRGAAMFLEMNGYEIEWPDDELLESLRHENESKTRGRDSRMVDKTDS